MAPKSKRQQEEPPDAGGSAALGPQLQPTPPQPPKRARTASAKSKAAGGAGEGGEGQASAKGTGSRGKAAAASATGASEAGAEDAGPRYYLMKADPAELSVDDLAALPDQTKAWEGLRGAAARNIMKGMKAGEQVLLYHRSCKVPAVVGVMQVVREAYPDPTAFDKESNHYDASSTPDKPKWWAVDVQLVRRLARPVTLAALRAEAAKGQPIADMVLLNGLQGARLSVQRVTAAQWQRVMELGGGAGGA